MTPGRCPHSDTHCLSPCREMYDRRLNERRLVIECAANAAAARVRVHRRVGRPFGPTSQSKRALESFQLPIHARAKLRVSNRSAREPKQSELFGAPRALLALGMRSRSSCLWYCVGRFVSPFWRAGNVWVLYCRRVGDLNAYPFVDDPLGTLSSTDDPVGPSGLSSDESGSSTTGRMASSSLGRIPGRNTT